MSNALVVDANTLKQKITERVINSFTDLIPEAVFAQMVDETIKMFFTQPQAHDIRYSKSDRGWGNSVTETRASIPLTTFQVLVWEQVQPIVAEKLKEYFDQEKNALTAAMENSFVTDMKQPVAYNVAALVHALGQAQQTQLTQRALDMMHVSLQNLACHMNVPSGALMPRPIVVDPDTPSVNTSDATVV